LSVGSGLTIRSTSFATAYNAAPIIGWYSPGSSPNVFDGVAECHFSRQ
jgi:hypothetical protein